MQGFVTVTFPIGLPNYTPFSGGFATVTGNGVTAALRTASGNGKPAAIITRASPSPLSEAAPRLG